MTTMKILLVVLAAASAGLAIASGTAQCHALGCVECPCPADCTRCITDHLSSKGALEEPDAIPSDANDDDHSHDEEIVKHLDDDVTDSIAEHKQNDVKKALKDECADKCGGGKKDDCAKAVSISVMAMYKHRKCMAQAATTAGKFFCEARYGLVSTIARNNKHAKHCPGSSPPGLFSWFKFHNAAADAKLDSNAQEILNNWPWHNLELIWEAARNAEEESDDLLSLIDVSVEERHTASWGGSMCI